MILKLSEETYMELIDNLILPPMLAHVPLLPYLIFFMLFVYLSFTGILLVSLGLSLAFRVLRQNGSRELLDLVTGDTKTWIFFGLLPLVSLVFLFGQYLYDAPLPIHQYLIMITGLALGSFVVTGIYRRIQQVAIGGLGFILLFASQFFLASTMSLLYYPEHWSFIKTPLPHIFSITVLTQFLYFLVLSALVTGAAILFFYFQWGERMLPEETPNRNVLKLLAIGHVLGPALILPVVIILQFFMVPSVAVSDELFATGFLTLLSLLVISLLSLSMILKDHVHYAAAVFVFTLITVGLFVFSLSALQTTANREHSLLLLASAQHAQNELTATQEARYTASLPVDENHGEKIYNERCNACHRFDSVLIGPAYNEVLPKYEDDLAGLTDFIRNPHKVDPDFPVMPNQGLSLRDCRAIAGHLMKVFSEAADGGGSD